MGWRHPPPPLKDEFNLLPDCSFMGGKMAFCIFLELDAEVSILLRYAGYNYP